MASGAQVRAFSGIYSFFIRNKWVGNAEKKYKVTQREGNVFFVFRGIEQVINFFHRSLSHTTMDASAQDIKPRFFSTVHLHLSASPLFLVFRSTSDSVLWDLIFLHSYQMANPSPVQCLFIAGVLMMSVLLLSRSSILAFIGQYILKILLRHFCQKVSS